MRPPLRLPDLRRGLHRVLLSAAIGLLALASSLMAFAAVPGAEGSGPASTPVEEIRFYAITDAAARQEALLEGKADILPLPYPAPDDVVAGLAGAPGIRLEQAPGYRMFHLAFNVRSWPMSDTGFRRGIAYGIDRGRLVQEALDGMGFVAAGYLAASDPFFHPPEGGFAFDPAEAENQLERAGFTPGKDGVRLDPRTEEPLRPLVLLAPTPEEAAPAHRAALAIAEAIRALGIPVEVEALPWAEMSARIQRSDFDLYALSVLQPRYPAFLYSLFHSSQDVGGGLNTTGIQVRELDQALQQLRAAQDGDGARQAARRAQRLLYQEVPWVPLFHVPVISAVRDGRIGGLIPMPRYGATDYRNRVGTLELRTNAPEGAPEEATVRWVLPEEPGTLDPFRATSPSAWEILGRIFEPLWAIHSESGEPVPWLAKGWKLETGEAAGKKGGTRLTFWLRDGVTWHDGTPFTAEDVRFTFEQAAGGHLPGWGRGLQGLAAVEAPAPDRVVLHFSSPSYWHFYQTDVPILPAHIWEGVTAGGPAEEPAPDGEGAAGGGGTGGGDGGIAAGGNSGSRGEVEGGAAGPEAAVGAGTAGAEDGPADGRDNGEEEGRRLVGTGPFRFAGRDGDGAYRLVRYAGYQRPAMEHEIPADEDGTGEGEDGAGEAGGVGDGSGTELHGAQEDAGGGDDGEAVKEAGPRVEGKLPPPEPALPGQ